MGSRTATDTLELSVSPLEMPELPEVEAARGLLRAHCLNAKIISAQVEDDEVCSRPRRVIPSPYPRMETRDV
eukprot:7870292-Pyramimonas_sp.AAC.3